MNLILIWFSTPVTFYTDLNLENNYGAIVNKLVSKTIISLMFDPHCLSNVCVFLQ